MYTKKEIDIENIRNNIIGIGNDISNVYIGSMMEVLEVMSIIILLGSACMLAVVEN